MIYLDLPEWLWAVVAVWVFLEVVSTGLDLVREYREWKKWRDLRERERSR